MVVCRFILPENAESVRRQETESPWRCTKEVMRAGLNGIVSESYAAFERRSDRPELKTPAFQSLLHAGGDAFVSPESEGGLQTIVDHRLVAPLAESPTVRRQTRKGGNLTNCRSFLLQIKPNFFDLTYPQRFLG